MQIFRFSLFFAIIVFVLLLLSCETDIYKQNIITKGDIFIQKDSIYTKYSNKTNTYKGFNSVKAINAIAKIENKYFNNYHKGGSKHYGTAWYESMLMDTDSTGQPTKWNKYLKEMHARNTKPDSFHCTIYGIKALQAGFGDEFDRLQQLHKKHYGNHEHAGWSIAYLLTRYYNWGPT